jgi:phage terminase Nu1 subunit (DNA packaging protein)
MPEKGVVCEKVTAGELARVLGVSRKHVYDLLERGLPRDGRLFDLAACVQWFLLELKRDDDVEPENLQDARLALYLAQTEKLKLENAKMRRSQVDIEEAKGVLLGVASVVAGQLDALGPRLAPQLLGLESTLEIQETIIAECREVRAAISSQVGELGPDSPANHPTPTPKNSRSVGRRKKSTAPRKPRARPVAK